MYLGHGSWVPFAIFGVMFAMRYASSQRRRAGRRGSLRGPVPGSSFTDSDRPAPPPTPHADPTGSGGSAPATGTGTAPAWFRDPFVKHQYRYWSGSEWTEHVEDDGVPAIDPPPPTSAPPASR